MLNLCKCQALADTIIIRPSVCCGQAEGAMALLLLFTMTLKVMSQNPCNRNHSQVVGLKFCESWLSSSGSCVPGRCRFISMLRPFLLGLLASPKDPDGSSREADIVPQLPLKVRSVVV